MDIADLVTNAIMSTQEMEVQQWAYLNFYRMFSKNVTSHAKNVHKRLSVFKRLFIYKAFVSHSNGLATHLLETSTRSNGFITRSLETSTHSNYLVTHSNDLVTRLLKASGRSNNFITHSLKTTGRFNSLVIRIMASISTTELLNLPSFPIKSYAPDLHLYIFILFQFSEMCWSFPDIARVDVLKTSVVSGSQGFTSSSGPFGRLQSNSRANSQQWSSSSHRNQVQLKPGLQQT